MSDAPTRATEREPMRPTPRALALLVVVLGLALLSCDGPNRGSRTQPSAASGMFLEVVASPNTLRGVTPGAEDEAGSCALVQAKVFDTNGQLVDGITVQFTTSICCFAGPTEVNIVGITATTIRGVATVTFCAKRQRGTATITASVEDAFASTNITIL
jgi:hypothetical protein